MSFTEPLRVICGLQRVMCYGEECWCKCAVSDAFESLEGATVVRLKPQKPQSLACLSAVRSGEDQPVTSSPQNKFRGNTCNTLLAGADVHNNMLCIGSAV